MRPMPMAPRTPTRGQVASCDLCRGRSCVGRVGQTGPDQVAGIGGGEPSNPTEKYAASTC